MISPIHLTVRCPRCEFDGTPLSTLTHDGYEHDTMSCGVVRCVSCDEPFPVEIDAVRDAQHACLVALGEDVDTEDVDTEDVDTPDDETICDAVAAALNADGFTAESQYTGGGIWCVSISEPARPNAAWLCGTAADTWGGTLMEADSYAPYEGPEDGGAMQLLDAAISSDSPDAAAVAVALATGIRAWRETHR